MKETWQDKLVACVLMFVLTFVSTSLPIKFIDNKALNILRQKSNQSSNRFKSTLRYLNWFAAGVFLATTIVHMLPEVREGFMHISSQMKNAKGLEDHNKTNHSSTSTMNNFESFILDNFPLAEAVMCFGFFIIMFLEVFLHKLSNICSLTQHDSTSKRKFDKKYYDALNNKSNCNEDSNDEDSIKLVNIGKSSRMNARKLSPEHIANNFKGLNAEQIKNEEMENNEVTGDGEQTSRANMKPTDNLNMSNVYISDSQSDEDHKELIEPQMYNSASTKYNSISKRKTGESQQKNNFNFASNSTFGAVVFLLALVVHSLIEGFALGLLNTSLQIWTLFTAVIIHKSIVAATCGIRLAEHFSTTIHLNIKVAYKKSISDEDLDNECAPTNKRNAATKTNGSLSSVILHENNFISGLKSSKKAYICALIFSLSSPFGILTGLLVSLFQHSNGTTVTPLAVLLEGLATGTFLYVNLFEIIVPQLTQAHLGFVDSLSCFVGYLLLIILRIFFKD